MSGTKNALRDAWFPAPARRIQTDALECVRQALAAIEGGRPLPPEPATVFASALRGYLDGTQRDLTGALGLRPRRGGATEEPVRAAQIDARNQSIRRLFDLASGTDSDRSQAVAQWIAAASSGEVTEDEVGKAVKALREQHGERVPSSARQVLRIVRSRPADC